MPPDNSQGYRFSKPVNPTSARRSMAMRRWRSRSSRCTSAGSSTLSSTLRHGNRTGDWKTTPMSRRGPLIGVPRRSASPPEGGNNPAEF